MNEYEKYRQELVERPILSPNSRLRQRLLEKRASERAVQNGHEETVVMKVIPDNEETPDEEGVVIFDKKIKPQYKPAKARQERMASVINEILQIGETYFEENEITLSEDEKRIAIGIAAWIHHPASLKTLANEWNENEEHFKVRILSHLENTQVKNVGNEIFDRHNKTEDRPEDDDILTSPTAFNNFFNTIEKEAKKYLSKTGSR